MPRSKKCPNPSCAYQYSASVTKCPECQALICLNESDKGGVSKPNVKKKQSEAKTKNQTVYLGDGVFSVQYWQYHRCFVRVKSDIFDTGGDTNFCTKSSCTENRRLAIRNNTDFQCTHIQKVADDIEAGLVNSTPSIFDSSLLEGAQVDLVDVRNKLENYVKSMAQFNVVRISEDCYAITTTPSNMSCLDFVHVTRKGSPPSFVCAFGSRCDRVCVTIAKKTRTFSSCPHEHFANILSNTDKEDAATNSEGSTENPKVPNPFSDNPWLKNTSEYRFKYQQMKFVECEMKKIEADILDLYKSEGGFPSLYQSTLEHCPVCNQYIGPPQQHQGLEKSKLLTRNGFSDIHVLVQKCHKCKILLQPTHPCLLNVGDSLLISLDNMYLMRRLVHNGSPLSTVANSLLYDISLRSEALSILEQSKMEWISRLFTTGYLGLEALDEDSQLYQLCLYCGIIPEAVLGDGGEDVSCTLESFHLEITNPDAAGKFPAEYMTEFLDGLKCFFVGGLVYPSIQMRKRFPMDISTVPPIILPAYRGDFVYNTELLKDTRFTDAKSILGSQQLLMHQISTKQLDMKELNTFSKEKLKTVMVSIGFEVPDINRLKTKLARCDAIMGLYKSIESGFSQCHQTGNRKKASGGWYNESCLHGIISTSKILFLSETVRDVVDIKLSKRFNSPTNILDTPCTAAIHLVAREPEVADAWFAGRNGCFEPPVLGVLPSRVSIPKLEFETRQKVGEQLKPVESLDSHQHPKTGDSDKFFVGDRFHEKNNPHKSELCGYHNIDLVEELDAAKTSGQEVLNYTRNWRRLRSTCTQNLETHYFYNFLMDRAHNKRIVEGQAKAAGVDDVTKRHPDYYHIV